MDSISACYPQSVLVAFVLYWLPSFCNDCFRSVLFAFCMCTCFLHFVQIAFCMCTCFLRSVLVSLARYWFPSFCTGFLRSVLVSFVLYCLPFIFMCICFLRSVLVSFVRYWLPSFCVVLISPSCCFADEGSTRNILIPGFSLLLSAG